MIHPSNKALKPGAVEPTFNKLTKTRDIDWYWAMLIKQALAGQLASAMNYENSRACRSYGKSRNASMFGDDAYSEAFSARAALFLLVGDGTPWTDPTGKLTLWEGTAP